MPGVQVKAHTHDMPEAREQSNMKYEYCTLYVDPLREKHIEQLKRYGLEGWEAFAVSGAAGTYIYHMKRPVKGKGILG